METSCKSIFDIFSIGIGPSSSHTVGPMKAGKAFVQELEQKSLLTKTNRCFVELYGSLAFTGKGHGTDKAIIMGLEGKVPESLDPEDMKTCLERLEASGELALAGKQFVNFEANKDFHFNRKLTYKDSANALSIEAYDSEGTLLLKRDYFSIGGGTCLDENENIIGCDSSNATLPHQFETADELLRLCKSNGFSVSTLLLENEKALRPLNLIEKKCQEIYKAMKDCVKKGCKTEGILPGGLKVKRRAPGLYRQLKLEFDKNKKTWPNMEWLNTYAIAVNEENAAGGRVVTSPTNGAAGIIPSVLYHLIKHKELEEDQEKDDVVMRFLLVAGAIGMLYKKNASILGADVGCQGEVGVACSMAAGALAEVLGGTPAQVENAAEIGMEHNLGLTCDPVGGLVQIPCIERNAMGAIKAVNAAQLALRGDGHHTVTLDKVITTMKQTGQDMLKKYKETSQGGLAVNVIEC